MIFQAISLFLKYLNKIGYVAAFTIIPFSIFVGLVLFFRTKTDDTHLLMILAENTLLYINLNIWGIVFLKKLNKIIKFTKE